MEEKSAEATVRELMETDDGYDAAVWSQMAEQLGLQSMIIPEEYGGQGFGYVELGIALEEMGRSLLCAPFFSTVVLAGNAISRVVLNSFLNRLRLILLRFSFRTLIASSVQIIGGVFLSG